MHQLAVFLILCCVVTRQPVFAAGHLRKVVVEGSNLEIQCRIPPSQMLRMTDDGSDLASNSPPVVWVRFDLKDPDNREVISHGDTLLVDTNPRLRLRFDEEKSSSILIIDRVQVRDGGVFQCEVVTEDDVVSSSPIEVVIERLTSIASSASGIISSLAKFVLLAAVIIITLQ